MNGAIFDIKEMAVHDGPGGICTSLIPNITDTKENLSAMKEVIGSNCRITL